MKKSNMVSIVIAKFINVVITVVVSFCVNYDEFIFSV